MYSLQRQYYFCHILLIVCFLLFTAACAQRPPQAPSIRSGLKTDAKSTVLAGNGVLYFDDGLHSKRVSSRITAAVSYVTEIIVRYSVQVGSYSSKSNALQAQQELRSRTRHPSFLFENPDLHMFQLRVGPFPGKGKAQQVIEEIKTNGYPDAFYVAEDRPAVELPDLVLRDELGNLLLRTGRSVVFWSDDLTIEVDQVRYRGYATVFVNNTGRLTLVNVLNMEEYLKGVVPNEIGPASDSTYEALKAQAVAARTYAYKNLKQFDMEGYDLCASARCQVYSGLKTENDFASKAVEQTKGEIITYRGEPINALYSSTCGGRTENAEFMFEGWN